jgi:hypothetical protein
VSDDEGKYIPYELIDLITEELRANLFMTMLKHDLGEYLDHPLGLKKHDCYAVLKSSLHDALDQGFNMVFHPVGITKKQIFINSLFNALLDDINLDPDEYQPIVTGPE